MNELAYAGVTIAIAAGLAMSVYHCWRHKQWSSAFLLFFLPILAYFLWHFSVEAYNWGEVWSSAKEISVELDIAVALIDMKLMFTVFMLIAWVFVWNSVRPPKRGIFHRKK